MKNATLILTFLVLVMAGVIVLETLALIYFYGALTSVMHCIPGA